VVSSRLLAGVGAAIPWPSRGGAPAPLSLMRKSEGWHAHVPCHQTRLRCLMQLV
jgi:hypothetical protein